MSYFQGVEFEPGKTSEGGWRNPHYSQLGSLPVGPSSQITWAPNEAGGRWAANELSEQHWADLWQYWQQSNLPLTENLLWNCAMGTADTIWQSGGRSVSRTPPGFIAETLEPQKSYISEPELDGASFGVGSSIGGFPDVDIDFPDVDIDFPDVDIDFPDVSMLTADVLMPTSLGFHGGFGFVSKAESLEESHFFEASGGEYERMNFQGYESPEIFVSQHLEGWLQSEPTRRESLLDNQVLTEAVFLGSEKSGSECEENLKERSNLPSSQPTEKNKYLCPQCGKTFAYKSTLVRHEICHTREKGFTCVYCDKRFSPPVTFIKHERTHAGERPYLCPVCRKTYAARDNLLLHLNMHVGKKPYSCMECGESFFWNSQLVAHSAEHTGEAPFRHLACGCFN